MFLYDNVSNIKSVGKVRLKMLQRLGIFKIKDLLEYFPRTHEDRSDVININNVIINETNTVKGKIISEPQVLNTKNLKIIKVSISDGTGFLNVIWFNQEYLKNTLVKNKEYIFTGKIIEKFGDIQLESPEYEALNANAPLSGGRIVPIYPTTYKLSQKVFRVIIKEALSIAKNQIEEFLPAEITEKYGLCDRQFAIENIHFPKDIDAFYAARERLVFEELFLLQMYLFNMKASIQQKENNIIIKDFEDKDIINLLPFTLTNAQKNVLKEIKEDLKNKVMHRLIQGDVGSGKTAIAQIISYIFVKNGYQVAIMAPTDVLAKQHLKSFSPLFEKLGYNCVCLSASLKKKEKDRLYEMIEDGSANVVIGTHAIIQKTVNFKNLGLTITDEQHRFGVVQRNLLSFKGNNPHNIVMTATPIPRTLALILYGDLDISIIDEMPKGRQVIDTFLVNSSYMDRIYTFIKKNAEDKKQTYIVCPLIEESETLELKSVLEYTETLKTEIFKNYSVACIHGKMKNELKEEVMEKFTNGQIDILVATTVIEVGINVPNATIMVIENAERFGIAQLHQLRGRVGRSSFKSYCILISDTKSEITKERLKAMVEYSSGSVLSEKDLEIRGPGDFFGTRQHGLPALKIANLYNDAKTLKLVQEACNDIFLQDPNLTSQNNLKLKQYINNFFDFEQNSIAL